MITLEQIRGVTEKKFSHSSGPGGQNVNKTSTKVQLSFDIKSSALEDAEKQILLREYPEGVIHVYSQETRSQHRNLEIAFEHLYKIVSEFLINEQARRITKAPHLTKAGKIKKLLKDKWLKYKNRYMS